MTTMFTPDHEWINIEDHEAAVVGITPHAQLVLQGARHAHGAVR
jgi:glycine cleavage system H lipoate-binding protein